MSRRNEKEMKQLLITILCLITSVVCHAHFTWFDGKSPITYSINSKTDPVVTVALQMFCDDMQQVTGMKPVVARHATVHIVQRKGSDDGFRLTVSDGHILIEGNGGRGTAYGILELSRLAGVSPWVWWGDMVPQRRSLLTLPDGFVSEQKPSVALRGIFLNDEDWSLRPWSCHTYEPGPEGRIGVQTYKRIFQLLLRLRANTIWPAMHEGTTAFFRVEGAKEMADSCSIIIGTSHCEPLLRNNVGEWDVSSRGRFNYKTNRQTVHDYWIERLKEVRSSRNNIFTIGMRGIHDSSMEDYTTEQEKFDALQQVIDDQQVLLRRYVGDPSRLRQMFVPYKEVLQLYEMGLRVPDNVTLMWCDDNYGYMTRFSNEREQHRTGGAGIYYHLSYWGRPHDYLWLTTTQPGLICQEMHEAYRRNVRQLWIANVHDPKVAAYDLELFLDLAWNINSATPSTLCDHYRRWLCRQFGDETGLRLFPAMYEFFRLCGQRRPEFMGWTQVELDKKKYERGLSPVTTMELNRREAAERLASFARIKAAVWESGAYVRPELKDAFFAAIVYPVFAAEAMTRKMVGDDAESQRAYDDIQSLTAQYNALSGGRWRGLMDADPRRLPVFGNVRAQLATDTVSAPVAVMRQAVDYDSATEGTETVQMLGHSMRAVALPKGGELSYTFQLTKADDYLLRVALIPMQAVDSGDIRFSVSIDGAEPQVFSLKEPFRSERWKLNVLRGQSLRDISVRLDSGVHTLKICALDDHIVVDQWQLDNHPERQCYLLSGETLPVKRSDYLQSRAPMLP